MYLEADIIRHCKEKLPLNRYTHITVLRVILRETLLKKGSSDGGASPLSLRDISPHCGESPSNSLPKTFSIKFSPCRALPGYYRISHFVKSALYGLNSVIKSLEKGFGERTFPQKGLSPIITHKLLYKHHG